MRGDPKVEKVAASVGLSNARLVSWSKSAYSRAFPNHFTLFNASIMDIDGRMLWWGDIDATIDEEKLAALARRLETRLFVFFEGDARLVPQLGIRNAALIVEPSGEVVLTERWGISREGDRIVRPVPQTTGLSAEQGTKRAPDDSADQLSDADDAAVYAARDAAADTTGSPEAASGYEGPGDGADQEHTDGGRE
jgi:hypothetical protein